MKVLIACEESQAVCIEFRKLGHEAYSCDIQECSGGHPEYHIQDDVTQYLESVYLCKCGQRFPESLGKYGCPDCCGDSVAKLLSWDMVIAFPPCTHLACSGAAWFEQKRKDGRQKQGIDFFMMFTRLKCKWAIENPVGIMSKLYRAPDQKIQPWSFGDPFQKTTCLWLHGLPKLVPTHMDAPLFNMSVDKGEFVEIKRANGKIIKQPKWYADSGLVRMRDKNEGQRIRSKTFPGIARAMAQQWGNI